MPTAAEIFDLDVPYAEEGFRFEITNAQLEHLFDVHPIQDEETVSVDVDATAQITRTCTGFVLGEAEEPLIDVVKHRLRVWYVVPEASDQQEWPLGTFMFTETPRTHSTRGRRLDAALQDESRILDVSRRYNTSIGPPTNIVTAVTWYAVEGSIPINRIHFDESDAIPSEELTYQPGANRLSFMRDAMGLIPAYLYFDNASYLRGRLIPQDLNAVEPDHIYTERDGYKRRVVGDAYTTTNDLYEAFNEYVVMSADANGLDIEGYVRVPATAPHSFENLGYYNSAVFPEQGVPSEWHATLRAVYHALHDEKSYEWVEWDGPIDPRHDTHDIVEFDGINHHEVAWSIPCQAGATMHHKAQRIFYENTVASLGG